MEEKCQEARRKSANKERNGSVFMPFLPLVADAVEWTQAISQDRKRDRRSKLRWGGDDRTKTLLITGNHDMTKAAGEKNAYTYSLSVRRRPR